MTNLSSWHKNLNTFSSLALAMLAVLAFLVYGHLLFSRLLADSRLEKGLTVLEQARTIPADLLVERTVAYQNGLRLLDAASKLNPADSRANAELASAFKDIAENPELIKALDISSLEGGGRDRGAFYGLARDNYILAIGKEPANMLYHQGLGSVYEALQDFPRAEESFRKAISLDPQNASINLYLSKYFYARNRTGEFERYLGKVVELFKKELYAGGPNTRVNEMVSEFLRSINRHGLIE